MRVPERFDLALTVRSHGWYDLAPWRWDEERGVLARPIALGGGRVAVAEVARADPGALAFRTFARGRLSAEEARQAQDALATCLALDEDLEPFQERAAVLERERAAGRSELPDLRWALERGAGRLLRCPNVFEDAVKTLCTTNCSWGLTRVMVGRLCATMGEEGPNGERAFPSPAAMAARGEPFYRDEIRAGYRAPSLVALARDVADGILDLEGLRHSQLPTAEILRRLRGIRGFGPYAAEHLLRLLGRHDHLALDSWSRAKLARLRGRRRVPSDRVIRRWYADYGRWAGLAMWLEVTADWHGERPSWPPRRDGR